MLRKAYGHLFDMVIVNNDIEETISILVSSYMVEISSITLSTLLSYIIGNDNGENPYSTSMGSGVMGVLN